MTSHVLYMPQKSMEMKIQNISCEKLWVLNWINKIGSNWITRYSLGGNSAFKYFETLVITVNYYMATQQLRQLQN